MLKALWFVFQTELFLLWRRSQECLYPLAFFMMMVSLFPFVFSPDPSFIQKFMPGCFWFAALLSSFLSIEHIFHTEMEDGHLEQLLLSPIPFSLLIFVKLFAQWLMNALPLIILTLVFGLLFNLKPFVITALSLSLLLGTPIFTLIGSLGAALTSGLRQQGVLLGLLILPLLSPVLIFGINISELASIGLNIKGPIAFLAGLALLAILLLPWTIAAVLRFSLDE